MNALTYRGYTKANAVSVVFTVAALALCLYFPGQAQARKHTELHSVTIDPNTKSIIPPEILAEVEEFFETAEDAIQAKDINALMRLYSDSYQNGPHDKAGARKIWERIFDRFQTLGTMHNMRITSYDHEGQIVVIKCSGILLGKPKGNDQRVPVDSWTNEDHVISKSGEKWKLIGTYGKERKRLWFDKPMHPLF